MGNICSFYEYYHDFLDVNKGKKVNNVLYIKTSNRNEVLNREFSYPLIISKFNDNIYVSVSDKYYEPLFQYFKNINLYNLNKEEIYAKVKKCFSNLLDKFEVKIMYRMYKNEKINIDDSEVMLLNENTKKYFMNSGKKSNDKKFKEEKWNEMKYLTEHKRAYIISKDEKIASLSYISDIYNKGANIIVNTNEKYRNLGYGKKVVAKTSNFVIDNGLLPIYFVNVKNQASINLAKSLQFKNMATEIVVCIH